MLQWVQKWSDTWQLKLNWSECKVLHIASNLKFMSYSLSENGDRRNMEESSGQKDLGVWINGDMKFVGLPIKCVTA